MKDSREVFLDLAHKLYLEAKGRTANKHHFPSRQEFEDIIGFTEAMAKGIKGLKTEVTDGTQ